MFGLSPKERIAVLGTNRHGNALRVMEFISRQKGATTDECIRALGIPHQSAAPRVHDLAKSGCLERTSTKRTTASGSTAYVYVVSPTADFRAYVAATRTVRSAAPSRSRLERKALDAAVKFVDAWPRLTTVASRKRQIATLIRRLTRLASG